MDPLKFSHDSQQYVYQTPNVREVYHGPPPEKKFDIESPKKAKNEKDKKKKEEDKKDPKKRSSDSPFGLI